MFGNVDTLRLANARNMHIDAFGEPPLEHGEPADAQRLTHLQRLEAESIQIMREVAAECRASR